MSNVLPTPSDKQGYLMAQFDASYNSAVRAVPDAGFGATQVRVELDSVDVQSITVAENQFDVSFWLQMRWVDTRITWDTQQCARRTF
jgi:hypothetical protein